MHPLIERHREGIKTLAERHGIENMRVFGSMARGDATEASDVDLLVSVPRGVGGLALGGLLMDVQDLLQRRVDVVSDKGLHLLLRDLSVTAYMEPFRVRLNGATPCSP